MKLVNAVVPGVLVLVGVIHALPLLGVLGPAKLTQLYGVSAAEPNLALLLRHRAVLFGLLAAFLVYAAFRPELHRLALPLGLASVVSFLLLAQAVPQLTPGLLAVVRADWLALALLLSGGSVSLWQAFAAPTPLS